MFMEEVLDILESWPSDKFVYIYYDQDYDIWNVSESMVDSQRAFAVGYVNDIANDIQLCIDRAHELSNIAVWELVCLIDNGNFVNRQIEIFDDHIDQYIRDWVELRCNHMLDKLDMSGDYVVVQTDIGLRIIRDSDLDGYYLEEIL